MLLLRDLLSKDGEKLDIKINPDGTGQLHVPGLRVIEVRNFQHIKKVRQTVLKKPQFILRKKTKKTRKLHKNKAKQEAKHEFQMFHKQLKDNFTQKMLVQSIYFHSDE